MPKNRIPRSVMTERSRVIARIRQDLAFATYRDNLIASRARELLAFSPVAPSTTTSPAAFQGQR